MRIFLNIIFLVAILTATDAKSQESMNQDKLVVEISTNRLLAGTVETYGVLPATRSAKSRELVVVKVEDPEVEQVSIDTKENMEWKWRGHTYSLMRNEAQVGTLGIGVFADPNEALRIYRDIYFHTSVIPIETLEGDLGGRSARWWEERYKGFCRILFLRDNVVVSVSLSLERFTQMGGNASATMTIAKAIDAALVKGTLGVRRGPIVKMPRILKIETPPSIISRTQAEAKVHIAVAENPQDPNSKEVEIVRTLPFHVPLANEPNNKLTYEVTYITAGCVVTSQQVTITVSQK